MIEASSDIMKPSRKGSFKWLRNKSTNDQSLPSPYKIGVRRSFRPDEISSMGESLSMNRSFKTYPPRQKMKKEPTTDLMKKHFSAKLSLIDEINDDDDTVTLDNTEDEESLLQQTVSEIDQYMSEDQVFEARKVLENIRIEKRVITDERYVKLMKTVIFQSDDAMHYYRLLHDDKGWKSVTTKDNVKIHSKRPKNKSIQMIRTRTAFENATSKDFIRLVSLFEESDLLPLWIPRKLMKSCKVLCHISKYSKILHFQLSPGKLGIRGSRDAVVEVRFYHLVEENAVMIICRSIEDSQHCKIPPPGNKQVRVNVENAYLFELSSNNRIIFRNMACVDLKMKYVPFFISSLLAKGVIPFELIGAIQRTMNKFDGSPWQNRIKKRMDLYSELESRVREELNKRFRAIHELNASGSLASSVSEETLPSSSASSFSLLDLSSFTSNLKNKNKFEPQRERKKPLWRKRNIVILFLSVIIYGVIDCAKIKSSFHCVMKRTLLNLNHAYGIVSSMKLEECETNGLTGGTIRSSTNHELRNTFKSNWFKVGCEPLINQEQMVTLKILEESDDHGSSHETINKDNTSRLTTRDNHT